mmetsp:Transcript_8646/g.24094  ORF Transcript_8646/g.24094 Transcript_8646/m.24094 type:complete len:202 (-) Transcript_8646:36-641(-)
MRLESFAFHVLGTEFLQLGFQREWHLVCQAHRLLLYVAETSNLLPFHKGRVAILCANQTSGAVAHSGNDLSGRVRLRDDVSTPLFKINTGAMSASEEETVDVLNLHLLQRLRLLKSCNVTRLLEPLVVLTGSGEATSIDGHLPAPDGHDRDRATGVLEGVEGTSDFFAPCSCLVITHGVCRSGDDDHPRARHCQKCQLTSG